MEDAPLVTYARTLSTGDHEVPALFTRRGPEAPGPVVLFFHGLGARKEAQEKEASSLAREGLLVVTVDAPHHGARRTELLDAIRAASGRAANAIFVRMIREAIAEVPLLLDALSHKGHGPFGVAGISMGAFVALAAAAADPRIAAVASILGAPHWIPPGGDVAEEVRPLLAEAPVHRPERFPPRALLLANAGLDTSVPPEGSRRFAEALRPLYAEWPERLRYEEYPESTHFMREEDWRDLWSKTLFWFRTYLKATT